MQRVLVIEDDTVIADGMLRHLVAAGFEASLETSGERGLERLRLERPDVCVLDLMLPGIPGWRLLATARKEGIEVPIIVVSARSTERERTLELGADAFLVKPFPMRELLVRVKTAASRSPDAPA